MRAASSYPSLSYWFNLSGLSVSLLSIDIKELIPYYEKRYGKKICPVRRRCECDIPEDCSCPRCDAPMPYLYRNNGSKGQILCKVCGARFSPRDSRFS